MFNFLVWSFLLVCSLWTYSVNANSENIGIAFVHGTNDHRLDAATEYWKNDFTNALADALPNPDNKYVVHCDFSHFMWDEAAGSCLAEQLSQFISDKQITKLIVYTHSDGGNVMRWVLSNPSYDSRFMQVAKTIQRVIAIAPSSGGTILADEAINGARFHTGVGWLLGYKNDAVRQQRVGDMAIYNDELLFGTVGRPSLPAPFRVVVGSDVIASPFNPVSYCNGYMLNAGLKITKAYLEACSDGFLDCNSQVQAGSIWFYDWQKTENGTPLSHNQSRHSCLGLEHILRDDLALQE